MELDLEGDLAERAYPGFLDYFYEVTPLQEIGLLNIGSRPSHRKKGDRSLASVRAIAQRHGGDASATAAPGAGCTVSVALPV